MFVVGVLALASGALLAAMSRTDHQVGIGAGLNDAALIIGLLCGIGVILWARRVLTISQVGMAFGAGMLAAAMLGDGRFSANAWKFAWAIPLAIFVFPQPTGRASVSWNCCWSRPGRGLGNRRFTLVLRHLPADRDPGRLADAAGIAIPRLVADVDGVIDGRRHSRDLQPRDHPAGGWGAGRRGAGAEWIAQIDTAGSLILGGRPELAATIGLRGFRLYWFRCWCGAQPARDHRGEGGHAQINYDPNNGYVDNFMFGGKMRLHSTPAASGPSSAWSVWCSPRRSRSFWSGV